MASSNRHWPSMFKSKPCNPSQQWQHDINSSLISTACQKTPCTSVLQGSEERSPEPKPRWNPKPEQIRILEAIFNSGMVNPPRDEIRKIRAQLQQYGQVGDANVFYWFQNRKSRSKHKQRHHLPPPKQPSHSQPIATSSSTVPPGTSLCGPTATSSSSSSSQKSSPGPIKIKTLAVDTVPNVLEISNSPTAPVNQGLLQHHGCDYSAHDPFYFQVQQSGDCAGLSQNCCFSELSKMVQLAEQGHGQGHSPCSDLLLSELTAAAVASSKNQDKLKPEQNHCYTINEIPEVGGSSSVGVGSGAGVTKVTVFINDVAFDVAVGPLNLRDAFGDKAVLYNSSGQPVPTNEWGITLSALQHGAVYYLV